MSSENWHALLYAGIALIVIVVLLLILVAVIELWLDPL